MENFCSPTCTVPSTGAVTQYMSLLLNFLNMSQCSLSPSELWPADYGEIALRRGFKQYDFIIVGAGTAGSVLANRLSENPKWKILLVEAGGDPPMESLVPGLTTSLYNTPFNWKYKGIPSDKHSIFAGYMVGGKMLGGSGSINGMEYSRGNADDYNTWEALGNPTWGWKDVLPYFKKSETNKDFGGEFHSKNGPISVQRFKSDDTVDFFVVNAAKELGFKYIPDINAGENVGFTQPQGTIGSGMRSSTATAYLSPARNRTNLHVVKNALVTRLIVKSGSVTGVRIQLRGRKLMNVFARKEIIVSAGTFQTPHILMLSGIGPAKHLQEMGIPVVRNLSVGKNLEDHVEMILSIKFNRSEEVLSTETDTLKDFASYMLDRSGNLGTIELIQAVGYVNVNKLNATNPNFQFFHVEFRKGQGNYIDSAREYLGYNVSLLKDGLSEIGQTWDVLLVPTTFIKAKSRGEIKLQSPNPLNSPLVNMNLLSEKSDVEAMLKAIRLYQKFFETGTYRKLNAQLVHMPIPECDALEYDSDNYWTCFIRYMSLQKPHAVGTAKMGPASDADAVVDYRLRVRGLKGLRVIDASIMPTIPGGNVNAPVVMIAEKGADFIKEDWRCLQQI